jgi:hypothetical protein
MHACDALRQVWPPTHRVPMCWSRAVWGAARYDKRTSRMRPYERTMVIALEAMQLWRSLVTFAALTLALLLWAEDADARLESALSFDPSGELVFVPPAAEEFTWTGELAAADQPGGGQLAHAGGTLDGLFNRPGLVAGFAAGLLGSGVLGLLFGQGLFGGLSGVTSYLGLMFQIALLIMLVRLIWMWWSGRKAPAFAGLSPRQQAEPYLRSRNELLPGVYPLAGGEDASADSDQTPTGSMNTMAPGEPKG